MDQEKDILKDKGTGFKIPENYLEDFTVDIPDEDSSIIPKSNGLKVPENYFDELEERLFENLDSELPEDTGFKVPDSYFKNFEVKPEIHRENKVIQLFKRNRSRIIGLAVAASILLLFSIFPIFNNSNSLDFDSLSDNDMESWLELNSDEINSFELADIIDDEDLYAAEMISEEDISDYLIQTDLERWLPDN